MLNRTRAADGKRGAIFSQFERVEVKVAFAALYVVDKLRDLYFLSSLPRLWRRGGPLEKERGGERTGGKRVITLATLESRIPLSPHRLRPLSNPFLDFFF